MESSLCAFGWRLPVDHAQATRSMPESVTSPGSAQADMDPGLLVAWSGGGVALALHLSPPIVIGAPLSFLLWWNAGDLWGSLVGYGTVLWDAWTSRFSLVPPFLEPPLLDTYSSFFWSSFAATSHLCFVALVTLVLLLLLRVTVLDF